MPSLITQAASSILILGSALAGCCWFCLKSDQNDGLVWSSFGSILSDTANERHVVWEKYVGSSCLRSHHYKYYLDAVDSSSREVEFHISHLHESKTTTESTMANISCREGSTLYLNGAHMGTLYDARRTSQEGEWITQKYPVSPSLINQQGRNLFIVDIINRCACINIGALQLSAVRGMGKLPELSLTSAQIHVRKKGRNELATDGLVLRQANTRRKLASPTIGAKNKPQELWCRITIIESMFPDGTETDETGCIPFAPGSAIESDKLYPVPLSQEIYDTHIRKIKKGGLFVHIQGARVSGYDLTVDDDAVYTVVDPPANLRHLAEMEPTTGNKTFAIVRVSTNDASPTPSMEDLVDNIFGNGVTMKTQFNRCSMGKLQWIYAGGYDVMLHNYSINDFGSGSDFLSVAQAKLQSELNIASISNLANKILFCLAPGLTGWIAAAGVNHYRINVNGDWCMSLSVQMHEVGHTIGLIHSGEGDSVYGDETGYMGFGEKDTAWPRKCYNGVKNWQLKWYEDRQIRVNPFKAYFITLAAFVDYEKATSEEPCLVNIGNMYFIQFNRARKFNHDTEEKEDQVTVTADIGSRSDSLVGLAVGDIFEAEDFRGTGRKLVVKVCHHRPRSQDRAEAMVLNISMDRAYCSQWIESGGNITRPTWVRCSNGIGRCSPPPE